jgi:hypothetical protein
MRKVPKGVTLLITRAGKSSRRMVVGLSMLLAATFPRPDCVVLGLPLAWLFASDRGAPAWTDGQREISWYRDYHDFMGVRWAEINYVVHWDRRAAKGPALQIYPLRLVLDCALTGLSAWIFVGYARRRSRRAANLCLRCGYDLRGTVGVSDRCPECGDRIESDDA